MARFSATGCVRTTTTNPMPPSFLIVPPPIFDFTMRLVRTQHTLPTRPACMPNPVRRISQRIRYVNSLLNPYIPRHTLSAPSHRFSHVMTRLTPSTPTANAVWVPALEPRWTVDVQDLKTTSMVMVWRSVIDTFRDHATTAMNQT